MISDFRAEGWDEPLARLANRHDVVAITIDDPRETNLPDAGWVELEDAETGRRVLVDTGHEGTRGKVRLAAERAIQERRKKLHRARCGPGLAAHPRPVRSPVTPRVCGARPAAQTLTVVPVLLLALTIRVAAPTDSQWMIAPPSPTVGDTIWLFRIVPHAPEWRVRAGPFDNQGDVASLGDPQVNTGTTADTVRYAVVAWTPGPHRFRLPSLWLMGTGGRSDSLAGGDGLVTVRSVIPADSTRPAPKALLPPPRPPAGFALAPDPRRDAGARGPRPGRAPAPTGAARHPATCRVRDRGCS